MEFTREHNDLIYGALDIFLEKDSPAIVARDNDGISFSTVLGSSGSIEVDSNGDWDIILDGNKYYKIEKEVYSVIDYSKKAPPVEDLLETLSALYKKKLQDRSKILIEMIIRGLAKLIMDDKISVDVDVQFGHTLIAKTNNIGNVKIVLN